MGCAAGLELVLSARVLQGVLQGVLLAPGAASSHTSPSSAVISGVQVCAWDVASLSPLGEREAVFPLANTSEHLL